MIIANTSQKGLKDGWTRDTFILRKEYLEKIRALAYWERKKVKEVIDEALESYLRGKRVKSIRQRKE
jgi:uncharacterized protein YnzC (UPF0291/DUF896 family)